MIPTIILCGVVTLLCLTTVNIAVVMCRLFTKERSRRLSLSGFFWAIGFLPMAIVTISNLSFGNPVLLNILAFFRNPFLSVDLTLGAFAGFGEISFLMDLVTAVLLSSTMVITLSADTLIFAHEANGTAKHRYDKDEPSLDPTERREVVPYIRYCRILS